VLDHIRSDDVTVECFYFDRALRAYAVSTKQMYSNTPSDFDFKLRKTNLGERSDDDEESTARTFPDPTALAAYLASRNAVAFPAIHGAFGEDGGIQRILEEADVPFIGTSAAKCEVAFDKREAGSELRRRGYPILKAEIVTPRDFAGSDVVAFEKIRAWFVSNHLDVDASRVVVKPCRGGSSLGVSVAYGAADATAKAEALLSNPRSTEDDARVLIEYHVGIESREFTVVVLETRDGPVALLPTEVEVNVREETREGDDSRGSPERSERVFDFRRKYLPTSQVRYHAPARFGVAGIDGVRKRAEDIFRTLGLRDFARLDGFYVPVDDPAIERLEGGETDFEKDGFEGRVPVFTDINVVSGMEQTSFLFLQASQAGLSHGTTLRGVLANACRREGVPLGRFESSSRLHEVNALDDGDVSETPARVSSETSLEKKKVYVLFGGDTSERQVSLMSGVNVWLKLRSLPEFDVTPVLFAPFFADETEKPRPENGSRGALESAAVFRLPYAATLRHTVEEVASAAATPVSEATRETCRAIRDRLREGFFLCGSEWTSGAEADASLFAELRETPRSAAKETLRDFAVRAASENAVVFNAVHGGAGEDGSLQSFLSRFRVAFTGSGAAASRLCMDKNATGAALEGGRVEGVSTCPKRLLTAWEMSARLRDDTVEECFEELREALGGTRSGLCVKPNADGCSTGVARLRRAEDLRAYFSAATRGERVLRLMKSGADAARDVERRERNGKEGAGASACASYFEIDMPLPPPFEYVVEPFVETVAVEVYADPHDGTEKVRFAVRDGLSRDGLSREASSEASSEASASASSEASSAPRVLPRRWVEVTVGVFGAFGEMEAFPPSLTVTERGDVLSLEEKFQGGTGVNVTPPPSEIISRETCRVVRDRIASAANVLGIQGFARIDAFVDVDTGEVMLIEANTVPGLTPSTVLFHQALAGEPSVEPARFLADAVGLAVREHEKKKV
jgi:D-alanine-D-alanine ligase-like ATP-grasp enzyme